MSTFSPNLNFEEVARGGDVGTWDTPTNSNWSISDSALGAVTTIGLNNSNVILSAAQFQSKMLTFNSTLTGSVTITFPTSFTKSYEIYNACTGSSAFTITLETTSGGLVICAPPGEIVDVVNAGGNMYYKNLGRVGAYIDFGVSGSPNWIVGCSVPPYLPCTGVSFSSGTYPVLATMLGQTTTPDRRGTVGANLDQGANRLTTISSLYAVGGAQSETLGLTNLPATPAPVSVTAAVNVAGVQGVGSNTGQVPQSFILGSGVNILPFSAFGVMNVTVSGNSANLGSGTAFGLLQPTTIMGITWIRAA